MVVVNADMAPSIRLYIIFIKIWRKKNNSKNKSPYFYDSKQNKSEKNPHLFHIIFSWISVLL